MKPNNSGKESEVMYNISNGPARHTMRKIVLIFISDCSCFRLFVCLFVVVRACYRTAIYCISVGDWKLDETLRQEHMCICVCDIDTMFNTQLLYINQAAAENVFRFERVRDMKGSVLDQSEYLTYFFHWSERGKKEEKQTKKLCRDKS